MTPKQNELYQWLLARADNPISPTFSEMAAAMGLKSKSNINRLIGALEAQGMVTRSDRKSRTIRVIQPNSLDGVPTAALIAELKRRGEQHGA